MVRTFSKRDASAPVKPATNFPCRVHRIVQENTDKAASSSSVSPTMKLQNELKAQLMGLPFATFAACVCDLLRAEGYTRVQLAKRATYKGRNTEGGYDIEAFLPSPLNQKLSKGGGVLHRKVIVRIKQFKPDTRVFLRMLDELRGACLRTGAIEAVLITTSDFSPVIREVESALRRDAGSGSLAPVHLLNGQTLVERLVEHGIGIQKAQNADSTADWAVDTAYFTALQQNQQASLQTAKTSSNGSGNQAKRPPVVGPKQQNIPHEFTLTLAFDVSATLVGSDDKNLKGGA